MKEREKPFKPTKHQQSSEPFREIKNKFVPLIEPYLRVTDISGAARYERSIRNLGGVNVCLSQGVRCLACKLHTRQKLLQSLVIVV